MGRPKKEIKLPEPIKENITQNFDGLLPIKEKKDKVKLVSYAIKMVIPTGQYANIQPEITVKGGTLEEAHAYCAPHMNKLWKEYFLISERRPEPEPIKPPVSPKPSEPTQPAQESIETPPVSSVALLKATQAIKSCLSLEALDLITSQVERSVKLTNEDKEQLMTILSVRFEELNNQDV